MGASKFSEDISGWNVSFERAGSAFAQAADFSYSLCAWAPQLSRETTVSNMFTDSGCPVTDDPDIDAGSPFCHRCGNDALVFYSTEQLYEAVDEYMEYLLSDANETAPVLQKYGPIENWQVHLISDFGRLFDVDRKAGLEIWKTDDPCPLTNERLSWNMSNAINVHGMFIKCTEFIGDGLETWDTSKVQDFSYMFADASAFNRNLSWSTRSAITMENMFAFATSFEGNGLRNFDVSNVENLAGFVDSSGFNPPDSQELADWNVSSSTTMDFLFYGTEFDGNISAWQVSKVETF